MWGSELARADGPVASLHPETARRVLELLVSLAVRRSPTVLVFAHQVELVRADFERVIARAGRVVACGAATAFDGRALERALGAQERGGASAGDALNARTGRA
jgi:phosphonate transport system ATP-binding protein